MEQTVKEMLIQFIKYKGLSQRKFEIELGEDGKPYIKKEEVKDRRSDMS